MFWWWGEYWQYTWFSYSVVKLLGPKYNCTTLLTYHHVNITLILHCTLLKDLKTKLFVITFGTNLDYNFQHQLIIGLAISDKFTDKFTDRYAYLPLSKCKTLRVINFTFAWLGQFHSWLCAHTHAQTHTQTRPLSLSSPHEVILVIQYLQKNYYSRIQEKYETPILVSCIVR